MRLSSGWIVREELVFITTVKVSVTTEVKIDDKDFFALFPLV